MALHKDLKDGYWFAAACRMGRSFSGSYYACAGCTIPAMKAVKRQNIKNTMIGLWGDNNREASAFIALNQLQLFAELSYNTEVTEETVAKRFTVTTGEPWESFMDINGIDMVPELYGKNEGDRRISRFCMWQDILLGMLDCQIMDVDLSEHYSKLEKKLREHALTGTGYSSLYRNCANVARVLSIKASVGVRLYKAYKDGNRAVIDKIANEELVLLAQYVEELRKSSREYFFEIYKPIGWEVTDIRYGGLSARCESVRVRLNDYLSGKADRIEELEEERLPHYEGPITFGSAYGTDYAAICSASAI